MNCLVQNFDKTHTLTMAKRTSSIIKPFPDLDIFSMIVLVKGPNGELGGYIPNLFHQSVSERCMCCYSIPRSPFQVSCGHDVCRSCLFDIVLKSENPSCFQCHALLNKTNCQPNHQLNLQLNLLTLRCCPFTSTCEWRGKVDELGSHFRDCAGISGVFRSWMQSIQTFLGDLEHRSGKLDSRMDELERAFNSHYQICKQRYIEQDGRSKYITEQLRHVREQCNLQPKNAEKDPLVEEAILQSRALVEIFTALAFDLQDGDKDDPEPQAPTFPEPQAPPFPEPPNPDTWSCAYCTFRNSNIYHVCQACAKTRDQQSADNPDITRVCMGCAAHNPANSVICQNCQKQF